MFQATYTSSVNNKYNLGAFIILRAMFAVASAAQNILSYILDSK